MARGRSCNFISSLHSSALVSVAVFVAFAANMLPMRRATALVGSSLTRRVVHRPTFYFPIQSQSFTPWNLPQWRQFSILMATVDEDEALDTTKTLESTWNVPGLKKELQRLILRCHKKIGKSSTRLRNAQEVVEKLTSDDTATLEQLEQCPNIEALEFELNELRERLSGLNELEKLLGSFKSKKDIVLPEEVATLALQLGVNDAPPKRPPRGPKKKKGPRQEASRLPYRRFYSINNTEIRVCSVLACKRGM